MPSCSENDRGLKGSSWAQQSESASQTELQKDR